MYILGVKYASYNIKAVRQTNMVNSLHFSLDDLKPFSPAASKAMPLLK